MATTTVDTNASNAALFAALNGTSSSSSTKTTNSAEDMQNRFLNLLVTQLKNQDPLNPMDNAQMTTQLSQISTVSGIEKLNTTLGKLLDAYSGTQNMQAAAMIGKTVLVAGSNMELTSSGAVGGVTLAGSADKVTVTIKNAAGTVVSTESLGSHAAGTLSFNWDGKNDAGEAMPAGQYTFSVTATRGGNSVDATALEAGTVSAITLGKDGLTLQLGNNKTASYSDVQQIMN